MMKVLKIIGIIILVIMAGLGACAAPSIIRASDIILFDLFAFGCYFGWCCFGIEQLYIRL